MPDKPTKSKSLARLNETISGVVQSAVNGFGSLYGRHPYGGNELSGGPHGGNTDVPFGPLNPMNPLGTAIERSMGPRAWDYPPAWNATPEARGEDTSVTDMTYQEMRDAAEGYDVYAICVDKVVKKLQAFPWRIVAKVDGEDDRYTEQIAQATAFFEKPDKVHMWPEWLGGLVRDLKTLDALCIAPVLDFNGDLHSLPMVDPATIKLYVTAAGYRPEYVEGLPDEEQVPAYAQVIKGFPRTEYHSRALLWYRQNVRSYTPYGYSPVEWIQTTMSTAIRKQWWDINWFTSGVMPVGLLKLPAGSEYTATEVWDWIQSWVQRWQGSDEMRQLPKPLMPGMDFIESKPYTFTSALDELKAILTAVALGVSPQTIGLTSKVNKATAQVQADVEERISVGPDCAFLAGIMTDILAVYCNMGYLKFVIDYEEVEDTVERDKSAMAEVSMGLLGRDEYRGERGRVPLGVPVAFDVQGQGPVPLTQFFAGTPQAPGVRTAAGEPDTPDAADANAKPGDTADSGGDTHEEQVAPVPAAKINLDEWQETIARVHKAALDRKYALRKHAANAAAQATRTAIAKAAGHRYSTRPLTPAEIERAKAQLEREALPAVMAELAAHGERVLARVEERVGAVGGHGQAA